MKTFMTWVKQCQYKYQMEHDDDYQLLEIYFYDNNYERKCRVSIYKNVKGGYVEDDNGYVTKCKSIKDVIGLVKFLTDGTIE